MPREIVVGAEPFYVSHDGEIEEQGLVQVVWHDDLEHVQVAVTSRDSKTLEVMNEGLYVNVDRRGINDLIRYLRRARDRAYGKDE